MEGDMEMVFKSGSLKVTLGKMLMAVSELTKPFSPISLSPSIPLSPFLTRPSRKNAIYLYYSENHLSSQRTAAIRFSLALMRNGS